MISTSVPLVALINTSVDKMLHAKTPVDHTPAHARMVSHSTLMVRHAKISMNVLKIPTTATRMQLALTPAAVSHANVNLDSLVMVSIVMTSTTAKISTAVMVVNASKKIMLQHVSAILVSSSTTTENVLTSMNAKRKPTIATRMLIALTPVVASHANVKLDSPVMVSTVMISTFVKTTTAALVVLASRKIMPQHASATLVSN